MTTSNEAAESSAVVATGGGGGGVVLAQGEDDFPESSLRNVVDSNLKWIFVGGKGTLVVHEVLVCLICLVCLVCVASVSPTLSAKG